MISCIFETNYLTIRTREPIVTCGNRVTGRAWKKGLITPRRFRQDLCGSVGRQVVVPSAAAINHPCGSGRMRPELQKDGDRMSGAPGYVHISQRNRANGAAAMRASGMTGRGAVGEPSDYRSLRAMNPSTPIAQPEASSSIRPTAADNEARGFVLYVGLNEDVAAQNGTSLVRMVQDIRAYAQTLVPQAESYAAVAIAPAGAEGSDLDVVRDALGDPTAPKSQAEAVPAGHAPAPESKPSQPAGVLIDLSRREVFLDGDFLNLTYKEFELLNYLVENSNRTAGREELLDALWRDADETPNERTIDVHIRRLRSKLGRLSNTVRTVRGQGYRFYEHPEVVVWAAPEYSI